MNTEREAVLAVAAIVQLRLDDFAGLCVGTTKSHCAVFYRFV
jgi:hypothetical protein